MPIEYTRRIPLEQYGYAEYRATGVDAEELAEMILQIDTLIAERPTASMVYTGQPDNGTYDEPPEYDDVPFEDEPVRNTPPARQQASGRSQGSEGPSTDKQVRMMYAKKKALKWTTEDFESWLGNRTPEELTAKEASQFIDQMIKLEKQS